MPLQIRRGTEAERLSLTTANGLLQGELLYNTSDKRVYIGTGVSGEHQGIPVTGYTNEDAQDAAAGMFTSGSHSSINFSYDDASNVINVDVDLSNYRGFIVADGFKGSIFADDSTQLVNAVDGNINLDGTVKGNIIPDSNVAYDIGSASYRFRDLYLSGTSLYLGSAQLTSTGSVVNLPAGSTVGGIEIALATESITRDLIGSVIGEDSTILVDATSNSLSTGRINISENVISAPTDTLTLAGLNDPSGTQTQVVIPLLTATTSTSLIDAVSDWKMLSITGHNTSVSSPVDISSGEVLGALSIGGFQPTANDSFSTRIGVQVDPAGTATSTYLPTKLFVVNQPATELLDSDPANTVYLTFDSLGRLAVNQENAQATLDVNGDAIIRGGLKADLTGSLFSDASTMIFDGTDGKLMTANINLIGETGNTPVDTVSVDSWLEVTVNGATKYIPLYD